MYMLHRMNTRNDARKRIVAMMLLNVMAAVPAIIIRAVNCSDISVVAFMVYVFVC